MPKNPNQSTKVRNAVTSDGLVIAMKAPDQPLTYQEQVMLNLIYNESVLRLNRVISLLDELHQYFQRQPANIKSRLFNLKQYLIEDDADPSLLHALRMIKRHFYIAITNNSMRLISSRMNVIRNNLLKTYKGLQGKLDIHLTVLDHEPSSNESGFFEPQTYVLICEAASLKLYYYENGIKKQAIPVDDINEGLTALNEVDELKLNESLILRQIMLYHATSQSSMSSQIFISDISKKKQLDSVNSHEGYVWSDEGAQIRYYGALHLDYRLLISNPLTALYTLTHEASHRYAWVNDRGYYHQTKLLKNGLTRPYPADLHESTLKALNNADSYAHFVLDVTGPGALLEWDDLPDWVNRELIKNLPAESSQLVQHSIFAEKVLTASNDVYQADTFSSTCAKA